jgi:hypothetical protein
MWKLLDEGKTIHWVNSLYEVRIEDVNESVDIQRDHFTRRNNKLLSIRCISNGFGSIMFESEVNKLYVKENNS